MIEKINAKLKRVFKFPITNVYQNMTPYVLYSGCYINNRY